MTSRDDDVDARVRTLYGRTSTAEPPAAVDDAIRAAARLAVASAPHAQSSTTKRRSEATRAWWSLAAAATVAAIAIGIVEMMPTHEREEPQAPTPPPLARADVSPPATQSTAEPATDGAAPTIANAPEKREVPRAAAKPRTAATPAASPPRPAREIAGETQPFEDRSSSAGTSLESSTRGNATGAIAPQAFPAAPAAPPAPEPPIAAAPAITAGAPAPRAAAPAPDMASRSGTGPQPMAKSRAAAAETANVTSFDERVKAIRTLVQERRYDEARRRLLQLQEEYPERIDTLAPELRALLTPR